MKNKSTYIYQFKNGKITISRGVHTRKYDWYLEIDLTKDSEGNKRFIFLDRKIFLTRKFAKETAEKILTKYKLL